MALTKPILVHQKADSPNHTRIPRVKRKFSPQTDRWSGSALFLVAGMATAEAADTAAAVDAGPVIQNSQAMEAADQPSLKKMSIRQQIQSQLSKDGYTDVAIIPSSFLIHAKDKQGNPVEMVIGPDSLTEVTDITPKRAAAPDMAAPQTVTPTPKT